MRLGIPFTVVFVRVAREPARNKGVSHYHKCFNARDIKGIFRVHFLLFTFYHTRFVTMLYCILHRAV
jgi:hypothetical protein